MFLQRAFIFVFSFFVAFWTFAGYAGNKNSAEIQQIDAEIQELVDMKRGYEARALRHENLAEYLQFDQQAVLETRRHLQLAEENRQKAELVQKEIDRLKAKKQQLQQ